MKRLTTRERKILRTGGLVLEQGIWRIRTNQELSDLRKYLDIVADVKKYEMGKDWTRSKNG